MSGIEEYKSHYKSLIKLGVPIVIGQVGMIVLGVADTLMIGRHSTMDLGAASFVNNVMNLAILFGNGFAYGLTPIAGSMYGRGDERGVGVAIRSSLVANVITGIVITAMMLCVWLLSDKMGQPEELLGLIKPYLLILTSSLIFIMVFNAIKIAADAIGDTLSGMWIMVGGNSLNILLNYILIYGVGEVVPEMGLLGAGLATLISRIVMVLMFAGIVMWSKKYREIREGLKMRTEWGIVKELNKLGWPIAFQMGMETASFSVTAVMMGWLGTLALAAHQVMVTISTFTFMVFYGIGAAVAVRVSYFNGQEDRKNVRQSAAAGYHIILGLILVMCTILYILRNSIGGLFSEDDEVIGIVAVLVPVMILYQFGDGLQITYANALRGIADVKVMMWMAFVAYFVISIPIGYVMAFVLDWGAVGLWMAFPFGLTSAGVMFWMRFRKQTRE